MRERIIARENELSQLDRIYHSDKSEFVAIYGRRRVGKTYLVREYFEGDIVFQCSGLSSQPTKSQLKNFHQTLRRTSRQELAMPGDWLEAFDHLIDYLECLPVARKVVFLDELPWMDTPGSDFIAALEHFWNGWASARRDVVLIVCGSATSWMMDKLIHNHGGLYGRLTERIQLLPFDLRSSEQLLRSQGVTLSRYEVAVCYMILGGIPYYLSLLEPQFSLAQNIDRLLFNPNGRLFDEFQNLYAALFRNSADYVAVVECLSQCGSGMTRQDIISHTGLSSGNGLSTVLANLESCGFIRKYANYSARQRGGLYQLVDFFTLFHFRFLRDSSFMHLLSWQSLQRTPAFYAWAGYSFELLSLLHVEQIKRGLGISGVLTHACSWRSAKAQVDLVIDRNDNTINLCEMKFCEGTFEIDSRYETALRTKVSAFVEEVSPYKSVQLTLVSTYGLQHNAHSGVIQNEITLDELFA